MSFVVSDKNGKQINPLMGCYGIGVSRVVAAVIEANNDEFGIIWPTNIAPFKIILINTCINEEKTISICNEIYASLIKLGVDVLYDDTNERAGIKVCQS